MRMMFSLTLIGALVSLVTGCETSNQNYSQAGRVVDVTKAGQQNAGPATVNPNDPVYIKGNPAENAAYAANAANAINNAAQNAPRVVTDEPVVDNVPMTLPSDSSMGNPVVDLGSIGTPTNTPTTTVNPPRELTYDEAYNGNTLLGGVPDAVDTNSLNQMGQVAKETLPPPTTQASNGQLIADASRSTASGNWLLVDSAGAQMDTADTDRAREILKEARAASDASARTVYQNKLETTAGPDKYRVAQGDTLYSIAFRYGLDYHALAKLNKIDPPYNLSVGQVLTLHLKASEAPSYIVQKGDTLYSIAKKNGQSVAFLAGVNNLEPPYNLTLGQKILLSRDPSVENAQATAAKENIGVPVAGQQSQVTNVPVKSPTPTNSVPTQPTPKPVASNTSTTASTSKPATTTQATAQKVPVIAQTPIVQSKTRTEGGVTWSWPTTGKVIEQFSTAEQGNKGLDIAGNRGQAILAASDGTVVYSGNALRGFGNLIIINHTNEYLSAYAHNDVLLVKEGQKVKRGQQIARMGSTDTSSPRLHFEIRYRGQSVNPISYLPK